jgi:hypothetical protein
MTIKINGTSLIHKNLVLIGGKPNALQPPNIIQDGNTIPNPWPNVFLPVGTDLSNGRDWFVNGDNTFDLPDDTYTIVVQSGNYSVVTFSVTSGIVDYDHSLDSVVSGRGTDTLVLIGVNVTIDARYIIGRGVILPGVWEDFRTIVTGNFLPNWTGHKYIFIVGSGLVADFLFNIDMSGNVVFDSIGEQYASGNNTNYLALYGYPVLVDARNATNQPFEVVGPWDRNMKDNHNPSSESQVVMGNFMPLLADISSYSYELERHDNGSKGFHLDGNGVITLSAGCSQDLFEGMKRIVVT